MNEPCNECFGELVSTARPDNDLAAFKPSRASSINKSGNTQSSGSWLDKRNTGLLLAAMVTIAAVFVLQSQREPVRPIKGSEAVLGRISLSMSAAEARIQQALQACDNDINAILDREFEQLERLGGAAAEKVASYRSCCTIIYQLAKEKLGSSVKMADYIRDEIKAELQPTTDGCARELNAAIERYELSLKESTVTLASELAAISPVGSGVPINVSLDVTHDENVDETLKNLGYDGATLGVLAAFDVFAVVNTRLGTSLISRIATLATSVFARPAATAAGSAVVAAADGPVPVGDVVAVVGGLWTAYDIYATQKSFEKDMKTSLSNSIFEMKRSVHRQVRERVAYLQQQYQRLQDQVRNRASQRLGGY